MKLSFFVNYAPVPQPRQRHALIDGHVRNYTPAKHPVQAFKIACRMAARDAIRTLMFAPPFRGPLRVDLLFLLPRPQRLIWKTKPMPRVWAPVKPDRDNLEKSLNDSLKGTVWVDDAQIVCGQVAKMYASGDEPAGVQVTIETV